MLLRPLGSPRSWPSHGSCLLTEGGTSSLQLPESAVLGGERWEVAGRGRRRSPAVVQRCAGARAMLIGCAPFATRLSFVHEK